QNDIVVGTPIAGRNHADLENIVGMFVNTLSIRNEVKKEETIREFVSSLKQTVLGAYENQNYQFEDLVNKVSVERDTSRNPIFDVMFNLLNQAEYNWLLNEDIDDSHKKGTSKFDLNLTAIEFENNIYFDLEYSTRLFKEETINRIVNYLKDTLNQVSKGIDLLIGDIQLIREEEKEEILQLSEGTKITSEYKVIQDLFRDQVEKNPLKTAIKFDNIELNYQELNKKSNQLASLLRAKGIKPNDIVGLMLDRSVDMIIGVLGIIKSGGAYLPIDLNYPDDRKAYMLENSGATLVLIEEEKQSFELSPSQTVEFVNISSEILNQYDAKDLEIVNKETDLFYVIYTSGSTGNPKGVMLEHRNLINLIYNNANTNLVFDRVLQFTSISFDVSFQEIFSTLLSGGQLFLISEDDRQDINKLFDLVEKESIKTLFLPTAFAKFIFNREKELSTIPESIKHIIVAGEQLVVSAAFGRYLQENKVYLHNHYGPTESHVVTTITFSPKEHIPELPAIGKPIQNTSIYILDESKKLQAKSIVGEIYIGGIQIGRGYYENPELTKEKFISHPFKAGERLYRTGDLARWLPDGNIEFLGRIDHQVKIRGFRIELGEIESVLLKHENIKESVVLALEENNEKYLCAYVVSKEGLNHEELRAYISEQLPDYMIPSYFVELESLPLTTNGKVNRKALPSPEIKAGDDYVAPSNEIEEKLVEIWSKVLNINKEEISVNANFFSIGGHSLKATVLTSNIHKEIGVEFPLRDVFLHSTIKSQASRIEKSTKKDFVSIPKAKEQSNYPVSSAQKRLYLLQQFDLSSTAYNMPGIISLGKEVDKSKIEEVFKQLINRHESFRTSIIVVDHEPVQIISKNVDFELEEISAENIEIENIRNKFIKPFDLSKAPFLRVSIVDIKGEDSLLMIDMHHIISDGTSHAILEKEFQALLSGEELSPLSLLYKDYSQWQNSKEQQEHIKDQEQYWLNKFEGEIPILNLPIDFARPSIQSNEGATVNFVLSKEESEEIRFFAEENDLTLYMSLLSVFTILLSKLSGQDDVVVGAPIAGRNYAELENIVGMFVNTLSIRNEVKAEETIREFVSSLKQTVLGAYQNQNYQFEDLVDKVSVERDTGRNPIFDVMFNLLNQVEYNRDISGINNENTVHTKGVSKFDMTITAVDYGEQISFSFEYCTKLFKAETIDRFIVYFKQIVGQLARKPEIKISAIDILSEEEKHQLLYEFNNIKVDYPKDKTIHHLFQEQVERTPENVAVSCDGNVFTYNELNRKANIIAHHIREIGIGRDDIISIFLDRSIETVFSMLGVLKSGGAYLPLDPDYPEERIDFILNDSRSKILISTKELSTRIEFDGNIICVEEMSVLENNFSNIEIINNSSDLCYIIYTSGTTGMPKGVMIEHKNLVQLFFNDKFQFDFNEKDIWTMFHSHCFDFSVWEMYGALLYGGKLIVIPKIVAKDVEEYYKLLSEEKVTVLNQTPSAFYNLSEIALQKPGKTLENLRYVIFGGEALKPNKLAEWFNIYSDVKLINMYGITETTVHVTYKEIGKNEIVNNISNIGISLPTLTTYVVDNNLNLVPKGVAGELLIGGDGLSRAYLGREDLTKEKFIQNPYKPEERLYRSGDLVKMQSNGDLEYLGRIDDQVQLRGFRIELGEIENALIKHENINECLVLAIEENNDKYLCAYILSKEELNHDELRAYISVQIPDYMLPSYFVQLDELPLTSNGKVNRKALPSPQIKAGDDYVAPSTEIEENLLEIWSEVLNIDKEDISTTANFFSIGGHSLKATILTSNIHKELGVEFPLREVFSHQTIKSQASQIEKSTKKDFVSIPKAKEQANYPLSSAQKRMYLLQQFDLKSTVYNMPFVISMGKEVDKLKIEEVFKQLINRHESFRTSIIVVDNEPVQIINEEVEFAFEELSIENTELENVRNKFIQAFDLSNAPYLRVSLVNIKGEDSLLMIDMHHIISDGTTHAILEKEFQALLSGEELSPLSLQYKDYSQWQNSKEQQELIKNQEQYWLNKFEGEIPVLNLPIDYARPLMQSQEGAAVSFVLSKEETEGIKSFTKDNELTLYMSLLSVFNILLSKLSGQDNIVVGTPIGGRNHADLENIVGIFINTLSIRNEVKGEETIHEFVSNLKQTVLGAYENQNYQFEDLVDKVSVERDTSRNPIFDVMINLLNQAEQRGDISEIDNENPIHTKGVSKFDLSLSVVDFGEQLLISFSYCTQLFKAETIDRFIVYFKQIINQLAEKSEIKISAIDILTEEEKHQLLYEFNDTQRDYPKDKTIHQLFEEQVLHTPEGIALVYKNTELTYQELNQRSNQLSHILVSKGLKPGNIVGIILDRSIEMIVGILSVLKAGGAYCPININNPDERKIYLLEDSDSRLILTRSSLLGDLEYEGEIVYADDFTILPNSNENTRQISTSKDLAYVIYTSGTTGKPKGVMIRHDGVVNTICWYAQRYRLSPGVRLLQLSNYSFDASVNQIFGTLTGGASLYIIEESVLLDLSLLYSYLEAQKITVINSVPAIIEALISNRKRLPSLQRIISGGEKLSNHLKDKIINLGYELHNHYGPTEGTIVVLAEKCSEKDVILGKPKQNTQSYILSGSNDQLQPIGVKGELCISGEGISPGYLNNEDLTKEKFISHPFKAGERLYKTGDLAKWLPDGNIEFLGRIDHQIKIRGFRIELGEIENTLLKHENIKESVVLAREEKGDKYLCAYIVSKEELNYDELRAYISARLPDYMLPSYFVQLDELPLTSNGKVNRKALPSPEIKAGDDYVAPSNEIEEKLVEIWSKVLNIKKEDISVNTNFFFIGGHSLKATVLTSKIHKELGIEFPLRDVFLHTTIKSQASQIEIST
ncbi:MAG: amino acid adenylation domain-containing protein, partial [Bacteroidales bacterium]|nr:amino acid adenylation domain-containing protein [Bacteroidales bacterium]